MIPRQPNRPPADPHEAAVWWSARRRLGLTSAREEAAFAVWCADPANAAAWAATEAPLEDIGQVAALPEVRALREAALAAGPARHPGTMRWLGGAALAASLAGALFWTATPDGMPLPAPTTTVEQRTSVPQRYATRVGEQREIPLPDGSQVTLNTASVLEVDYGAAYRGIRLLAGQALFRVAKDTARPFVVTAGARRITATGTAFDVRLHDRGKISVLLVEGEVKVEPLRPRGLARLLPALARETLDPGEQLAAAPRGDAVVAAADVERGTSWSRGQLIFREDPIGEALAEVNRYSSVKMVAADERVAALRISGVFRADRSENFLTAVTAFYALEAEQQAPGLVVLKWRDKEEGAGK